MKMIGILLVAALGFVGCAVEPEESSTSQDISTGVRCDDVTWRENYYSDASHTTLVGSLSCVCFSIEQQTGTITNFGVLAYEETCSLE